MIRTQIQLPDELHACLKELAAEKEMTLAEVIRRSAEAYLRIYPVRGRPHGAWKLPMIDVGPLLRDPEDLRELANMELA